MMPAMLDDPTAPAIYRVSGDPPYPVPYGPLPPQIAVRQVTLRDRVTTATLVPFSSPTQVPPKLTAYLCELLNREIEKGDTYPMMDSMPLSSFGTYWFANFGAVMIMAEITEAHEVFVMEENGADWTRDCLGSFYIKPNYPGRSSHVCNGGFLVTDAARNRGVGRLMGEGYLQWAPKLGYTYSVFNLVYETNVASLRIWDALGFKRIGRVKGCGNLKSFPDQLVDSIMFGRELGGDNDDYVSEERFDKIRFYLRTGTYPSGSDRAEKSRLRSAATHYRLIPTMDDDGEEGKLMLKGKEVISDPHKQYEIARSVHNESHGGINKTTAAIAEHYHWVRIKETVSVAIRNCPDCKDTAAPKETSYQRQKRAIPPERSSSGRAKSGRNSKAQQSPTPSEQIQADAGAAGQHNQTGHQAAPMANMHYQDQDHSVGQGYGDMPVDPQIMHWDAPNHHSSSTGPSQGAFDGRTQMSKPDDDEAMGMRLRETLEAQMMQEETAYQSQMGRDR